MMKKAKVARFYSRPLMKQNIKSNWVLTVAICLVLCLMTVVISYAMNIVGGGTVMTEEKTEAQEVLYTHLFILANYDETTGAELSVDDFTASADKTAYDKVFAMMNKQLGAEKLGSDKLSAAIETLKDEDGSVESFVKQFEYVYALNGQKGVFTDSELSVNDMLEIMLSAMGLPADRLTQMANMDKTTMLNTMYFTVTGLIPTFLFIVIVGNSLIVNQVDSGSMAYVLATPTKRSAVANTQAIFLIVSPLIICAVGCIARCIAQSAFSGETNIGMNIALYSGMYILVEAVGGICYMGSCIFNQSRKATAFGGGITVWFFISSLLGMFGSKDMVNMGVGVEELDVFNKLTIVGLYDINSLSTVGTDSLDLTFVWKLCILLVIAITTYAIGNATFRTKDLPL